MKLNSITHILLLATLTLYVTSCSNDDKDDFRDPEGTITINMMDEENGKTTLGNSDVYIDNAYNFSSTWCVIAPLGESKGLANIPAPTLKGLARQVAIESGKLYQIMSREAVMEFLSGKLAMHIAADYYDVYVVSDIVQNDVVVGAQVKFVRQEVPDYDMPAYDTKIGNMMPYDSDTHELVVELSTSDFEYEPVHGYNEIEYEKKGNKLFMRLIKYDRPDTFGSYIIINNTYTYIYGRVGDEN